MMDDETTTYSAECALHPEFQPGEREAYADAVADLTAHQEEAHALRVVTHVRGGQTDPSTVEP